MTELTTRQYAALNNKRNKYRNRKVVSGGESFDSQAEYRRWLVLQDMVRNGEIRELRRQVCYELIGRQTAPSGIKYRESSYVADFEYRAKDGKRVVEDVKGVKTPEYRLKKKLMLYFYGIEINEVK